MRYSADTLIQHFTRIAPLSDKEIRAIEASLLIKIFPKGAILLEAGQIASEAYFVLEGCVRQYYVVAGDERITNFFTEGMWIVAPESMSGGVPVRHYLSTCEETRLVVGTAEREQALYKQFPRFESISRKIMETMLGAQQAQTASYHTDTPEERYKQLLEHRPDILQRVPQYQIASYIGVQPESLSRIRKRLAEKIALKHE
jgi:CRP-like cAMP-binding protein